ncbi:hypothetical protein PG984_013072 [Apiospora sp. TS-2023a]
MPAKWWTNDKKLWVVQGLCQDGALSKPEGRFPFGRVQNKDALHAFFESGQSEDGESYRVGKSGLDIKTRIILREDLAAFADQIPDAVKFTNGVPNYGNVLVRWVYHNCDIYPSGDVEDGDDEMDVDDDLDLDDYLDDDLDLCDGLDPGQAAQQPAQQSNANAGVQPQTPGQEGRPAEGNDGQGGQAIEQEGVEPQFHIPPPSEEYARHVNDYLDWVQGKNREE